MVLGEEARKLTCEHLFHKQVSRSYVLLLCLTRKISYDFFNEFPIWLLHSLFQCVDEWLRVNATCPTCRTSILPSDANNGHSHSDDRGNNNLINITHGDRPGQRLITLNFDISGDSSRIWKESAIHLFSPLLSMVIMHVQITCWCCHPPHTHFPYCFFSCVSAVHWLNPDNLNPNRLPFIGITRLDSLYL